LYNMMICISDGWMIPLRNTVFLHLIGCRRIDRPLCSCSCPCATLSSFVISHQPDIRAKFLSSLTSIKLLSFRSLDLPVYRFSHTQRRGRAVDGRQSCADSTWATQASLPSINSINAPDGHAVGFFALSTYLHEIDMTAVLLALGGDSS